MARPRAWHRPLPPRLRLRFLPNECGGTPSYRGGDWKRVREQVLVRDNYTCLGCGRTPANGAKLSVHHIEGYAYYGPNLPENLITLCESCHPNLDSYQQSKQQQFQATGGGS